ncbi:MAG: DinB family protein [Bacteroidota bacterium]
MTKYLETLFIRDLNKLKHELELYEDKEALWKTAPGISNSAGNLALHLIGNLKHFFGAVLGNTGFQRDREAEFNDKNVPYEKIIRDLDETIKIVSETLLRLSDEQLKSTYPEEVMGKPMNTTFFLFHLLGHLNYHLGQVNYHRRLLS